MDSLRGFAGLKVLEYYLTHPSSEIHLRKLAEVLKISPGSVKTYCDLLAENGIIKETEKGNLRLFRLDRDDFAVKELMKTYHLLRLKMLGVADIAKGGVSVAIYGSFASGNLDELSDLDILVIGQEADLDRDRVLKLEEDIDREIQLTILPHLDWERMKKIRDRFAESVLRNHVLIKGAEL